MGGGDYFLWGLRALNTIHAGTLDSMTTFHSLESKSTKIHCFGESVRPYVRSSAGSSVPFFHRSVGLQGTAVLRIDTALFDVRISLFPVLPELLTSFFDLLFDSGTPSDFRFPNYLLPVEAVYSVLLKTSST